MDTIFTDTRVAMHVSFLITSLPAMEVCSLQHVLIAAMESLDVMNRQQSDWLKRLIGEPSETVNFRGLTQYEVHGQCALIIEVARTRLPKPEVFAILARFAQTPSEKQAGVFGLVDYLLPASPTSHREAVTDLLWRRYFRRQGCTYPTWYKRLFDPAKCMKLYAFYLGIKVVSSSGQRGLADMRALRSVAQRVTAAIALRQV